MELFVFSTQGTVQLQVIAATKNAKVMAGLAK